MEMNNESIEEVLKSIGSEDVPAEVRKIAQETSRDFSETLMRPKQHILWEYIMKSQITKFAAAAVIIIAVLIGIYQFGGSAPAFADVVRPLLTARTATFKMTTDIKNRPSQTLEGMFMEPGRMRQTTPKGITISDIQQHKMMILRPAEKKALILEMENISESEVQRQANMFLEIRRRIREAQENENESVKYLGRQKVNGLTAIGYHVADRSMDMTVWADPKTLLPVRIEFSVAEMMGQEGTFVMSDIAFDVELDEKLFSTDVPEGYTAQTMQMDVSEPGEKDFIEALRVWADFTDGEFPSALNMKVIMEEFSGAYKKKTGLELDKDKDISNPRIREFMNAFAAVGRGIMFPRVLGADSDWHYVGKDKKFGDADTPIFWYRPEGSQTYRVIYGDLTVKDVEPENLPK